MNVSGDTGLELLVGVLLYSFTNSITRSTMLQVKDTQQKQTKKTYNFLLFNIRRKTLGQDGTVLQENFGNRLQKVRSQKSIQVNLSPSV